MSSLRRSTRTTTAARVLTNKRSQPTATVTARASSTTKLQAVSPFWGSAKVIVATNTLGCAISWVAPNLHTHVDLLGSGAFAAAAIVTANAGNRVSAACVTLWSVKLAGFLLYRVVKIGHDARLDATLGHPMSAAGFWIISALWGIVCSLPHSLAVSATHTPVPTMVRSRWPALAVFGIGFVMETVADLQKWRFKARATGQFCNVGLWSVSQHPNWCGNLLLWFGILLWNLPDLVSRNQHKNVIYRYGRLGFALLGPLFMMALFHGQATGSILPEGYQANLEKYGYGSNPEYTKYIDTTPRIVPNLLDWFVRSSGEGS